MKTLAQIQSAIFNIDDLLKDRNKYPLKSWKRRVLTMKIKNLQWVIEEVRFKE